MRIDGCCHCGAIRYVATIDPANLSVCHCTDCQTLSGSPYRVSILCGPEDIDINAGTPRVYRKIGDSGRTRLQYFCGDCGTPLFASDADPDIGVWSLRWGSVTQRHDLRPTRQIWCRSAEAWIGDVAALPGQATE